MTAEIEVQGLTVVSKNVLCYDYKGPMARSVISAPQTGDPSPLQTPNGAYIGHMYNGELSVAFLHADRKAAGLTCPAAHKQAVP